MNLSVENQLKRPMGATIPSLMIAPIDRRRTLVRLLSFTLGLMTAAAAPRAMASGTHDFFQGLERQNALKEQKSLAEILDRKSDEIATLPGVLGAGIALDEEKRALRFVVLIEMHAAVPPLPPLIAGVPWTIDRITPPELQNGGASCAYNSTPCHANQFSAPVDMGNSAFTALTTANCQAACTMGFKACSVGTEEIVYVTNAHCSTDNTLSPGSAAIGSSTIHVGPADTAGCSGAGSVLIGVTAAHATPSCAGPINTVDAAAINSQSQTNIEIRDVGVPSTTPGVALPGDIVQKSGRTTGYTMGVITATNAMINIAGYCGGALPAPFFNQIMVLALNPPYSLGGDSGSAVLNMQGEIVGLHFAGTSGPLSGVFGFANPIGDVLGALGLSLDFDDCVSCALETAADYTYDPPGVLAALRTFRDDYLRHHPQGKKYIDIYYHHTDDVVALMKADADLLIATAGVLAENAAVLQSLTKNRKATISQSGRDKIALLLGRLSVAAQTANNMKLKGVLLELKIIAQDDEALRQLGIQVGL